MGNSVYNNAETGYGASSEKGSFNGYTSVRKVDSKNINFKVGGVYPDMTVRRQQGEEFIKNGLGSYKITSASRENYNVYGNINISSDYIASGFYSIDFLAGYLTLKDLFPNNSNEWEIVTKIHTPKFMSNDFEPILAIHGYFTCGIYGPAKRFILGFYWNGVDNWQYLGVGSIAIAEDEDYWIKLKVSGTSYKLFYSKNGIDFIEDISMTIDSWDPVALDNVLRFGRDGATFKGSMDLKETYINVNNSRWKNLVDINNISYGDYKLFVPEEEGLYFEKGGYYRQPEVPLSGTVIVGSLVRGAGTYIYGFSSYNYLWMPVFDTTNMDTAEFTFSVYVNNPSASSCVIGNPTDIYNGGGFVWRTDGSSRLKFWCTTNNSSWTTNGFDTGIDLTQGLQWVSFIYNNGYVSFNKSLDGVNWITGNTVSTGKFTSFYPRFGIAADTGYPFQGGVFVDTSHIELNGKVWWSGITDGTIWEDTSVLPIESKKYSFLSRTWLPYRATYLGNMTIGDGSISNVYEEPANSMNTNMANHVRPASIVDTLEDSSLDIYRVTKSSTGSTISMDVVPGIYLITLIGGGGGGAQTDGGVDQYGDTGWAWHYGHNAGAGGKFKGYASLPSAGNLTIVVGGAGSGGGGWGGDSYATYTPTGGSTIEIARARGGHGGRPDGSAWYVTVPGGTVTYDSNYIIQVLQADQGAGGGTTWAIHI